MTGKVSSSRQAALKRLCRAEQVPIDVDQVAGLGVLVPDYLLPEVFAGDIDIVRQLYPPAKWHIDERDVSLTSPR
ncbi:hypothetical protein OHB12_33745 [Nocardia sp. NBC_01730]|uniref:hypothetical protein n=1 Tax=Nocardia sp. NBC_01730 TaxID=2975998 RepID=UPI002E128B20|nr:hypothetical protein OHB12_33745 [Nocardia sp. NBC_01730]